MNSFMIRQQKEKAEARIEDMKLMMKTTAQNLKYAQQTLEGQLKNGFIPSPSLLTNVANMARRMMITAETIDTEQRVVKTLSDTLRLMEA